MERLDEFRRKGWGCEMQHGVTVVETQSSELGPVEVQSRPIASRRPEEANLKESSGVRMTRTMSPTVTFTHYQHLVNFVFLALWATLTNAQFRCPDEKGFFADPQQCDLYYFCNEEGHAEERLCKDGLVFRDDNPKKDFCDIPANVPCGDRILLRKLYFLILFYFGSSILLL